MSLLGQTNHPLMPLFMGGMPESGRMGDYVFSQEGAYSRRTSNKCHFLTSCPALDQIITQIMESTNAHRPVPATEEIIEKLPREILEVGSTSILCFMRAHIINFDPHSSSQALS